MLHQPGKFYTLIEVPKENIQPVFYFLSERKKNVFLDPDVETLDLYTTQHRSSIIIKPLVTEAPIQNIQNINTTSLEKMLVDLFVDTELFSALQGTERSIIFKTAFERYTINFDKMLRYADRRRKKETFKNYLKNFQITGSNEQSVANS